MSAVVTTTTLLPVEIERLEHLYSLRGSAEVKQFLEQNSFLVPLLLEARDKIAHYFPGAPVFLEVASDPEIDNHIELVVAIAADMDVDQLLEQLARFDDNWGSDADERAQGKLLITLE